MDKLDLVPNIIKQVLSTCLKEVFIGHKHRLNEFIKKTENIQAVNTLNNVLESSLGLMWTDALTIKILDELSLQT